MLFRSASQTVNLSTASPQRVKLPLSDKLTTNGGWGDVRSQKPKLGLIVRLTDTGWFWYGTGQKRTSQESLGFRTRKRAARCIHQGKQCTKHPFLHGESPASRQVLLTREALAKKFKYRSVMFSLNTDTERDRASDVSAFARVGECVRTECAWCWWCVCVCVGGGGLRRGCVPACLGVGLVYRGSEAAIFLCAPQTTQRTLFSSRLGDRGYNRRGAWRRRAATLYPPQPGLVSGLCPRSGGQ